MPLRPPHLQSSPTLQLCFDRITVRDPTAFPIGSAPAWSLPSDDVYRTSANPVCLLPAAPQG